MTENQWNKEIVREYFRCIRDEDLDRLLIYMHPGVEMAVPGDVIGAQCVGTHEVKSYFQHMRSIVGPGAEVIPQSVLGEDNTVFADTLFRGVFVEGTPFEVRLFWLFSFRDRKIDAITLSYDTQALARGSSQDDPTGTASVAA